MNNPFSFEIQRSQPFSPPAWAGQNEYEATACGPFTLVSVENPGGGRIKNKTIPTDSDLVVIQGAFGKTPLHRLAAEALKALVCAARADGIKHPQLLPTGGRSGFRSLQQQAAAWKRALADYKSEKVANKWVGKPGFSAHQSGRAIDFYLGLANGSGNVAKLIQTPAYKWMVVNAYRFGFYPYPVEPWHWEYNPPAMGSGATPFKAKQESADTVRFAQRVLNAAEGEHLDDDGVIGRLTRAALARFRTRYALGSGDVLDEPTALALVQRSLEELAQQSIFPQIGVLDSITGSAIARFKSERGFGSDPTINTATRRALIDALAQRTTSTKPGTGVKVTDRDVGETLAMAAKEVLGLGITLKELLVRHQAESGGVPIEVLLAFIHFESGNHLFADATSGKWNPKYQKYSPPYYELGVFQTPGGAHGCIQVDGKKICKYEVPGLNVASSEFGKGWYRLKNTYPTKDNWTDPTMQVRIGLWNVRSPAERVATEFSALFPSRLSEWYLRMAVLYSFAQGAGWTRAFLSKYKNELLSLPENQRWDFLRGKQAYLANYGTKTFAPENVDEKMALAAKLRAVLGVTAASGTRPPTSTTPPSTGAGISSPINTPLPRIGPGFYSHSGTPRQYGIPETIRALQAIGATWLSRHPQGPRIGIGDISFRGGGKMSPHKSHQKGVDVDISIMRNDRVESGTQYQNSNYSRALTQELVSLIRANTVLKVERIYFNDRQVQGVKPWPGHDNHLHVRFCAPGDSSCISASQKESEFGLNEWETAAYEFSPYSAEVSSSAGSRNSPDYIRWVQSSLNKILGMRLSVDGDARAQTRSAIRSFQRRAGLDDDGRVGAQTERALIAAGASPPSGATVSSGSNNAPISATPTLLAREKASYGETLYLNIGLGMGKSLASTGIYIPNSFRPDSELVIVLYLHGWKGDYPGNAVLINGYWDGARFPFFALREEVNESGQNVIFVAPSLGPKSEAGSLRQPGGFDAFMKQVLSGLNEHYLMPRYGSRIRDVRSILLSAHSGGGSPMLSLATGKDQYAMKIKECWCYDSMYGPVAQDWLGWAKSHPQQRLYVYSGPAKGGYDATTGKQRVLPRDNAEAITRQRLANVCVQPSRAKSVGKASAHYWVPIVHLKERLLNSPCVT